MLTTTLPRRFVRLSLVAALSSFGLLLLLALTQVPPVGAAPVNRWRLLVGETCFATPDNGATVYSSTTAQAVRDAVWAAAPNSVVKIAGYCPGVLGPQLVQVPVALTLSGGYTLTNWTTAYPLTQPTRLDALGGGRVLLADDALTLTNLTLQNGVFPNGSGAWFSGPAILSGTTFFSNTASGTGGGAQFNNTATLTNTAFTNNTAATSGGAFFVSTAAVTLTNSSFTSNRATTSNGGSAIFGGPATLNNTTFFSNTAGTNGGGAFFNGFTTLTATTFTSNTAGVYGGGAYFSSAATLTNATFSSNTATLNGGGAYFNSAATLTATAFTSNTAGAYGGGAYFSNVATLTNPTFNNNTALNNGGGAHFNSLTTLSGPTFFSNTAGANGGGAFFDNTATLTNPTFSSNTAITNGGGAFFNGLTTLTATTFNSNTAGFYGGGAYFNSSANLARLTNATFSYNRALLNNGGGAYFLSPASLTNTAFISNTANGTGGGAWFNNTVTLTSPLFLTNTANSGGGAFFNSLTRSATLTNALFSNNRATTNNGGGAYFGSPTTLSGPTFSGNLAGANGGGAFFTGTVTLTSPTFSSNTATSNGGGAYFFGIATLTNPTFRNNAAGAYGGGIYFNTANAKQVTNSLFDRNRASNQGAAIYVADANPLDLQHATIVSPTLVSGTAVYVANGIVNITNTLIASHTVGVQRQGGTINENYNLFANVTNPYNGTILRGGLSLTGTAGFYNTAAYTLTSDSTALDHGTNLNIPTDYFGNPRPQGLASDIGYAESPYTYTLLYTFTAQPTHMFANGVDVSLLTFTATNALGSGAHFYGRVITFAGNNLGTLATANPSLNANGVATTTYTVGNTSGTGPLTATLSDLGNLSVTTASVTLKSNPLIGSLGAQFGGQIITYTFVVTNVEVMTQTVVMSGSVPNGGNTIAVTGGISVATGGDYGWGYVEASNLNLAPNASHTLQWTVQFIGFTGDVETQGHAESSQARLRLPATLRVYRVLLMPVYKP